MRVWSTSTLSFQLCTLCPNLHTTLHVFPYHLCTEFYLSADTIWGAKRFPRTIMSLSCDLQSSWVSCLLILLLPYCSASWRSDPLGPLPLLQVSLPINSTFLSNGECLPERNTHVHCRRTLCSSCYTGLISRFLSHAETAPEPFSFPSYRMRSAQDEHLGVWSTSQ